MSIDVCRHRLVCELTSGELCNIPNLEQLCEAAVILAIGELEEAIEEVEAELLRIEFDQRALIHDVVTTGVGDVLGDPNNPTNTDESALIGTSEHTYFGGDLDADSWWHGVKVD